MIFTTIPFDGDLTEDQVTNIASWVAALRSGDYNQGRRVLASLDGSVFCCLGVACEIKGVEKSNGKFYFNGSGLELMPESEWFKSQYGFPPMYRVVSVDNDNEKAHVAHLNDGYLFKFPMIADVIESVFIKREVKEFEN